MNHAHVRWAINVPERPQLDFHRRDRYRAATNFSLAVKRFTDAIGKPRVVG